MLHIGISGPIAAGKTTVAQKLTELAHVHGYSAETIAFAKGIRELVATEQHSARVSIMAGLISSWGWDSMKAHIAALMIDDYMRDYPSTVGVKNRRLLQLVGTEVGREFMDEHFWIHRTKQLFRQYPVLDYGFTDDLRFNNEAMAVDVHVAITLTPARLECYHARLQELGTAYTYANHASERSLTLPPLFTIPVCFTDEEVTVLYHKLDTVRRLR